MRIEVFTWQEVWVATIGKDALFSFTHTDEINGEDSVNITTTCELKTGYRLLWRDKLGVVHEHVCQDPKATHEDGQLLYTDTALNSICELYGDYIEDKRPYGYTLHEALAVALAPTRWTVGTVEDKTAGSYICVADNLTFYHISARAALTKLFENLTYAGLAATARELETEITVSNNKITSRKVNLLAHRGAITACKRFTYARDLESITRTESYGAITACYGYGKGEETDSGGYGRKLTFGDINGGLNYVADVEALEAYGRLDNNGNKVHVFGTYENSDCEDAQELLDETKAYLKANKTPAVEYEADVTTLGSAWDGVEVGEQVQIVDTAFEPELRCHGRVTKLVSDVLGNTQTITISNYVD